MAKLVKSENPDGTSTVKVAKGGKVKTVAGKTATGGKIVGKLPKKTTKKPAQVEDFDIDSEELSWDEELFDETVNYDDLLEDTVEEPTVMVDYIYVTRDGIVGSVNYDKLQIVDTTGVDEDGLNDLSYASFNEREQLAAQLRNSKNTPSKHYFNDTGEYGKVKDLKVLNTADLTKSELNKIYSAGDPFVEADNYENSNYKVLTANAYFNDDYVLQDELVNKGLSY